MRSKKDQEEEEEEEEEELSSRAALVCLILLGAEQSRSRRADRRRETRQRLLRIDLLPNPRLDTPWQRIYAGKSDTAFITTMGFDVTTFERILERFALVWDSTPLPRDDTSSSGNPRLGARSLDAAGGLGLVLYWLRSPMLETHLQLIFALIPSTVQRYLPFARSILLNTVRGMPEGRIQLPQTIEEYRELSALITERHPLLEGGFGSIDGLSLSAEESSDAEIENATYNGWKATHCINNVLVFSPKGAILRYICNS
jgi:hypothetical protein